VRKGRVKKVKRAKMASTVEEARSGHDGNAQRQPHQAAGEARSERPAFARLHEEVQRIDGPGRWTVDSSARCCRSCAGELPLGEPFWTVLEDPPGDEEVRGLAAFFARSDYCNGCSDRFDLDAVYARWRTVLPEAEGPPKKIVNLASLLGTFLSLVEEPAAGENSRREEGGEGQRLAYLLALFLVRKRVLKWVSVEDGVLSGCEKGKTVAIEVPLPPLSPPDLKIAVAEFEALLA